MTLSDIELLDAYLSKRAQNDFLTFRRKLHPKMKIGWFFIDITLNLQRFYDDMSEGLRPKLIIEAPPQHGKSEAIIDFIAWVAGKNPDLRTIFASFSERLGIRGNLKLQRIYSSSIYRKIFPDTKINDRNISTVSGQFLRNREMLEYVDKTGYFRNTTVQGSVTGESLDLGIIDDPIKGRAEANSLTTRNKTWEWFTDDFFTRFSENGAFLMILTRWHLDDPAGRMLERSGFKRLRYQAIATQDEEHRKEGDALFPEHKSIDFLLERKETMGTSNFEALYQQNPVVAGGNIIKTEWWRYYTIMPEVEYRIIFSDTAQKTKEQNDYSVFECWAKCGNDIYLEDAIRGKWEAPELLNMARSFFHKHNPRQMVVEDKSSGTGLIQQLSRELPVIGKQRSIDKITRGMDASPWIESGHVYLPENHPFVSDLLQEAESFPNASHDDTLDPLFDAIEDMLGNGGVGAWW